MSIDTELLKSLLSSTENVSIALTSNFKAEFLDYTNHSFSPIRTLYSATCDFFMKYRTLLNSAQIEQYLRNRRLTDSQIKDTLLLFEEVALMLPSDKTFDFIVDEIRENYAKDVIHKKLTIAADKLIQNDLGKAMEVLKEGVFNVETVLSEETAEGAIQDSITEAVQDYKDVKNKVRVVGIPTGFPTFDRLTGGLKPGELDVVIAGSSEGKSTYMLNAAHYAQNILKKNVVYFSIELPKRQIMRRYFSLRSSLVCDQLRDGTLSEQDEEIYKQILQQTKSDEGKLYIVDQPILTAQNVAAKITELSAKIQVDLVVVDYLGIMQSSMPTGVGWQDAGNTALELRKVARQFKVPILTAMQVKQISQKGKAPKYDMTDIALSFLVIYHSDTVLSLKMANPEVLGMGLSICELNASIAKCRDGSRGDFTIDASFDRMKMQERI